MGYDLGCFLHLDKSNNSPHVSLSFDNTDASFLLLTSCGYVNIFSVLQHKGKKDILTNSLNLFYGPIQVNIHLCLSHKCSKNVAEMISYFHELAYGLCVSCRYT